MSEPIKNSRVASLVAEAADLQRSLKSQAERLEEIKVEIRKEAGRVEKDGGPQVEFDSPFGVCTVVFISDMPTLLKGHDPRGLLGKLAEDKWDLLFREKVVLAKTFREAFPLLNQKVKRTIDQYVEWKTIEPRVILPK
mgnify:CR=1 FL=1